MTDLRLFMSRITSRMSFFFDLSFVYILREQNKMGNIPQFLFLKVKSSNYFLFYYSHIS